MVNRGNRKQRCPLYTKGPLHYAPTMGASSRGRRIEFSRPQPHIQQIVRRTIHRATLRYGVALQPVEQILSDPQSEPSGGRRLPGSGRLVRHGHRSGATNRKVSTDTGCSGQRLPHLPPAAAQPIGNRPLAHPIAMQPTDDIRPGLAKPADHLKGNQRERQNRKQNTKCSSHDENAMVRWREDSASTAQRQQHSTHYGRIVPTNKKAHPFGQA